MISDEQLDSIVGAFFPPDPALFRVLLEATQPLGGDLCELGVLYGQSAVLIGDYLQADETFTVLDLFETAADDQANAVENAESYPGLTQAAFEQNYRRFHTELPVVVRALSSEILLHARLAEHRFVHIDASHLYAHVAGDIAAAQQLLKPDGVVVLDDFRAEHTPGVSAAAWQAVSSSGMRVFALSSQKMYATWGDPTPWREAVRNWAKDWAAGYEVQEINDDEVVRVFPPVYPKPHPAKRYVPEVLWPALAAARRGLGRA